MLLAATIRYRCVMQPLNFVELFRLERPVPHHQDAIKRLKQNDRARTRNKHFRTQMRGQIKTLRTLIEGGDAEKAQESLKATVSIIQRVASKGVIHRNQAARKISRLNKAVKALSAK